MKYIFIIMSTIYANNSFAQTVEQTRQYTYNKNGELTRSEHSNGNVETYVIDDVHNITQWQRVALVADLSIENARVSAPVATAGSPLTVTFQDKNIGRLAAAGHRYRIQYSENDVLDAQDPILINDAVASLAIGAAHTLSSTVTIPQTAPNGTRYLFITTDWDAQIAESNETNNQVRLSITVRNCTSLAAQLTPTPDDCANGNGAISVTPAGGAGPYTYRWRHDPNLNTNRLTGLFGGRYYVTVTDESNQCQTAQEETVATGVPMALTHVPEHITCQQLGAISVNVSGGSQPYTYQWSNSATTALITGLTAGNYSVTVTDTKGCIKSQQNIVLENTCFNTATQELTGVNLSVTPNPTDADLTLFITGATLQRVEIYDGLGKRVGKTELRLESGGKSSLPFQDKAAGAYYLQFELKDGRKIVRKVVKQ